MTHLQLQALRRLLFYSAAEAARWIAADAERPRGVEERTWNRWEAGRVPVPPNIARRVDELLAWRQRAVDELLAALEPLRAQHGPEAALRLVWYAEADDYPGPPELWRPHQSAMAWLLAGPSRASLQLVPFDAPAYQRWRQAAGLADDPRARARWAAEQMLDDGSSAAGHPTPTR